MASYKKGNVYEIKLNNGKYVYVCLMTDFGFGIFNYKSENQTDITNLLNCGFIKYISCKRGGISKGVWKLIGNIDLEKHNIEYPDLAIFMKYDPKGFTERSIIMRDGNSLNVPTDEYLALVEKGYIYGFWDNYKNFEQWLAGDIACSIPSPFEKNLCKSV
jgi:hypothetical protein